MSITESPSTVPSPASSTVSLDELSPAAARNAHNPYARFARCEWDRLADRTPLPLTQEDIDCIASLGDPIDMTEVDTIYRPLSALLQLYIDGRRRTAAERHAFL